MVELFSKGYFISLIRFTYNFSYTIRFKGQSTMVHKFKNWSQVTPPYIYFPSKLRDRLDNTFRYKTCVNSGIFPKVIYYFHPELLHSLEKKLMRKTPRIKGLTRILNINLMIIPHLHNFFYTSRHLIQNQPLLIISSLAVYYNRIQHC